MLLQDGTLRPMALCLGTPETPGGSLLGPPLGGDVFTSLAFPQGPSAGLQGQHHLFVGAASGAVYQVRALNIDTSDLLLSDHLPCYAEVGRGDTSQPAPEGLLRQGQ